MKKLPIILAFLICSLSASFAGRYAFVTSGVVTDVTLWDGVTTPPFSGTAVPVDGIAGIRPTDTYNGTTFTHVLTLQEALSVIFNGLTSQQRMRLYFTKTALDNAYGSGESQAFIKSLISALDVSDDSGLIAAKAAMLALPQWDN